MAKLNIVWTKTADIQFAGILDYWVKRNKSASFSIKLVHQVIKVTTQIANNPKQYSATDFKDTRIAPMGHFSIYFKVRDKEIIITAFWDNRQDPNTLLKILQEKEI